ncbi:hypothetical protein PoB_001390800 [Plakobranchus ocellatus]|uniref:Uncharacterized protein n=1 Tax=Plakobranchus ocellatus TaxID=259542 RepID=A0AAV3YYG2_9GAST|nr:hypothetical protein PoB_001390800 [Plakobranchus ocellatus]
MSRWPSFDLFNDVDKTKGAALNVRQSPGGYFYFWNLLVPLSVLINVYYCGLGSHEASLLLALCVGPHFYSWLVQVRALSTEGLLVHFLNTFGNIHYDVTQRIMLQGSKAHPLQSYRRRLAGSPADFRASPLAIALLTPRLIC